MQIEYVFFAVFAALVIGIALKWLSTGKKTNTNPSRPPVARRSQPTRQERSRPSRLHELNSVSELPSMLVASGDPISDAALNLKYGRNAQAILILKEAFKAQPPMMDAGMKLAEVLLSTNDIKSFTKVEARFKALTNEQGPFWEALKILKSDFLGVPDEYASSTYMDFSSTEISNLHGPMKKSNPRPIGLPSKQY
jgi:hypothetical protein